MADFSQLCPRGPRSEETPGGSGPLSTRGCTHRRHPTCTPPTRACTSRPTPHPSTPTPPHLSPPPTHTNIHTPGAPAQQPPGLVQGPAPTAGQTGLQAGHAGDPREKDGRVFRSNSRAGLGRKPAVPRRSGPVGHLADSDRSCMAPAAPHAGYATRWRRRLHSARLVTPALAARAAHECVLQAPLR